MREPVIAIFTNDESVLKDLKVLLTNTGYINIIQFDSINNNNFEIKPDWCLLDARICPSVPNIGLKAFIQAYPSIIFSGTDDSKKILEYFRAGVFDYLLSNEKEKLGSIIKNVTSADQNGGKSCISRSAIEITEKNSILRLLEEQGTKLEETNKELEAFCYSVSHDLRAPLRIIEGFGRMLLEKCSAEMSTRATEYVERILSSSARMQELIEDLLRLSRVNRLEITVEEVNLTKMVKGILDDLKNHEQDRVVKCKVAEGVFGRGDRALRAILFQNLLDNAWKYTKKTQNAEIEFGTILNDGKKKIFFIRDNGAGFKASNAEQLYVPFKRYHTETEFPGTGIGLATVKRIITRFGGTIKAESEPGRGACFSFTLGE